MRKSAFPLACAVIFAIAACSGSGGGSNAPAGLTPFLPPAAPFSDSRGKIKHVVIIVQENRSFDNFFDCFPGTDCVKSAPGPGPQPKPTPGNKSSPCPSSFPTPSPRPDADADRTEVCGPVGIVRSRPQLLPGVRHRVRRREARRVLLGRRRDFAGQPAQLYPYRRCRRKTNSTVLGHGDAVRACRPHVSDRSQRQFYRPSRSDSRRYEESAIRKAPSTTRGIRQASTTGDATTRKIRRTVRRTLRC